ncbi:hypothetical protein ACOMHN_022452 [Nucella lapillus]
MVQSVKKAYEKTSHVLFAQMGAALILATDDLPDTKFSSLLHAQALVRTQEQPGGSQPANLQRPQQGSTTSGLTGQYVQTADLHED